MRCQECGHSIPENHKFCGMCGAKLQPVAIDDNDPLEIERAPYRIETGSRLTSTQRAQIHQIAHRRELGQDAIAPTAVARQRVITGSTVENLVPEPEEVVDDTRLPRTSERATTISGPSFLGLGNEASTGFVYDDPRDGGYVYDSPSEAPEYLLTEVSRGVSWRAWALFLLLLIGAGLGYIQWRASQHQGPDLAQILSGNGATLDPNHPVINDANAKPTQKGNGSSASPQTDSAKTNDASKKDDNDPDDEDVNASAPATDNSTAKITPADSAKAGSKTADKPENDAAETSTEGAAAASTTRPNGKTNASAKDAKDEASDSDDATAPDTKRAKSQPVEEPAPPKSLGEKDPLIIQAEKYIQGRGVRQNCSAGVNLLRQAVSAGNPEASVKLGALYWSGTCVTQSKVAAYQWFARAHSLEPTNRWIERSRNSLWASLSPQEKQRAGGY